MGDDKDEEPRGAPISRVHINDKETGEELGVVTLAGIAPDTPEEELGQEALKAFQRFQAAEDSLDPDFIAGAAKSFPADILLDLAAMELTKRVVPAYCEKLEAVLNDQGVKGVDTALPHLKPATDEKGNVTVEIVLEDADFEKIQARHRELLKDLEEPSLEFARFAWTHITAWAINLMEEELGPDAIAAMSDQDFDAALHEYTFDKDPVAFEERLKLLANVWADGLGRMLIDAIDPESRSVEELEIFMGLRAEEKNRGVAIDPHLFDVAEYVQTSNVPIAESTRQALTKVGKWYEDQDGTPGFTFPRKSGKPIIYSLSWPEHIVPTGSVDLAFARREILGNPYTARLEQALEAHALKHGPGATFYLDGDSLFKALGLPSYLPRGEKLKNVAEHGQRVSYLRVNPITNIDFRPKRSGRGKGKLVQTIRTREGPVWKVVIQREYQKPLPEDPEAEPELSSVILEVTPGDCWRFFLDKENPLYFYRWTTAPALNPYTHNLAAMLEPYLEHQCGVNWRRLPWTVKVGTVLEATLDGTPKRTGGDYDMAALRTGTRKERMDVTGQWEDAMRALLDQGWDIGFDPATYPEELRPAWGRGQVKQKPYGYWDKLMAAKILVSPPPEIASRYAKSAAGGVEEKARGPVITGTQVRAAREKAGATQGQLAKKLGRSRPWVSLIESGKRNISPEDAEVLKRELHIEEE